MHRPRLNLSWGMNEKEAQPQLDTHIMPSTIVKGHREERQKPSNENIKVLT